MSERTEITRDERDTLVSEDMHLDCRREIGGVYTTVWLLSDGRRVEDVTIDGECKHYLCTTGATSGATDE